VIVRAVHLYPIKSTQGHEVPAAEVEPWGLAHDRRYMVVDEHDTMMTAREHPLLLTCRAEVTGTGLTLTGRHAAPVRVSPTDRVRTVQMRAERMELRDCGDEAATWLSELMGRPARLVWQDDPTRRPVDPDYGLPDDRVSLADGYPLLLTSTASLDRLNDWIAEAAVERGEEVPEPLPMHRFRPNVVVDGAETAFAEDGWQRVRIGDLDFRMSKLCARCVLTTIDNATLAKGKEPIRTLAVHRRWAGKTWFGVNLIPDGGGQIRTGDPVKVL
jgi:uncharacterized protein